MSNRVLDLVRGGGKGLSVVAGTFFPAGSGSPTVTSATGGKGTTGGIGWTVARTSEGLFTVTFDRKYPTCLFKVAALQSTAGLGVKVECGDYSASNGTLAIRVLSSPLSADNVFVSAEQTGNGAAQNVAHSLGVTPTKVFVAPTDLTPATVGQYSVVEGAHDGTNVVVTVTNGKKYKVLAWAPTAVGVDDIAANANNSIAFACLFSTHATP